jgi:hypothetical protein
MFRKTMVIGIVFSALTTIAVAEANADCSGVSCTNVTVDRLYVHRSGISIWTSGTEDFLNCDPGTNDYITLPLTHPNYEQIARVLEDSHQTGKRIWIRVDTVERNEPCVVNYVVSDN